MPSVTGSTHLVSKIQPNNLTSKNLPSKWYDGKSRRKAEIEGAVSEVFSAYLPSAIRRSAKIEVSETTGKLEVIYKGKKIAIPGITDKVVDSDTTYVKLDQMLSEAAQDIINKRNTELANRKGGRPSAY